LHPLYRLYPSCFSQDLFTFAVQSNSTTISASFSRLHCEYDVFLSFRGKDTRMSFTDHLYSALKRVGIHTFRDDDELPRGKSIFTELVNGIRRSMIFIVIFSKDYASSTWCLNELAEFMDSQNTNYKNTIGHTLFPIFYHVDPSDVQNQIGTFAKAFARHEERFHMERVNKWRGALTKAGNCAGWNVDTNRYYARNYSNSCTFSSISCVFFVLFFSFKF
jgi:hypothetical protein